MIRKLVAGLFIACTVRAVQRDGLWMTVHNVICHPLLSLAPAAGEPLHDITLEPGEDEAAAQDDWDRRKYEQLSSEALLWLNATTDERAIFGLDVIVMQRLANPDA